MNRSKLKALGLLGVSFLALQGSPSFGEGEDFLSKGYFGKFRSLAGSVLVGQNPAQMDFAKTENRIEDGSYVSILNGKGLIEDQLGGRFHLGPNSGAQFTNREVKLQRGSLWVEDGQTLVSLPCGVGVAARGGEAIITFSQADGSFQVLSLTGTVMLIDESKSVPLKSGLFVRGKNFSKEWSGVKQIELASLSSLLKFFGTSSIESNRILSYVQLSRSGVSPLNQNQGARSIASVPTAEKTPVDPSYLKKELHLVKKKRMGWRYYLPKSSPAEVSIVSIVGLRGGENAGAFQVLASEPSLKAHSPQVPAALVVKPEASGAQITGAIYRKLASVPSVTTSTVSPDSPEKEVPAIVKSPVQKAIPKKVAIEKVAIQAPDRLMKASAPSLERPISEHMPISHSTPLYGSSAGGRTPASASESTESAKERLVQKLQTFRSYYLTDEERRRPRRYLEGEGARTPASVLKGDQGENDGSRYRELPEDAKRGLPATVDLSENY